MNNKIIIYISFILIYFIYDKLNIKYNLPYKINKTFNIPLKWIPFMFICISSTLFIIFSIFNYNISFLKFIELALLILGINSIKFI